MIKRLFIVIVPFLILSCGQEKMDNELISQLKREAVEILTINSNSFLLDAYLWRDFMPGNNQNGMISINWLISTDSVKIPDNISMVKQYVIYKDEIWVADYENEAPAPNLPKYKLERISRNGPKWETEIYVDIISQIYDSKARKDYFVRCKNVKIISTS